MIRPRRLQEIQDLTCHGAGTRTNGEGVALDPASAGQGEPQRTAAETSERAHKADVDAGRADGLWRLRKEELRLLRRENKGFRMGGRPFVKWPGTRLDSIPKHPVAWHLYFARKSSLVRARKSDKDAKAAIPPLAKKVRIQSSTCTIDSGRRSLTCTLLAALYPEGSFTH